MCPRMADPEILANCKAVLRGESNKRVFWGNTMTCNLRGCDYKMQTGRNQGGDAIQEFVGGVEGNAQLIRDFNLFMSLGQD